MANAKVVDDGRRRRIDGQISRQQILEAATGIAADRGYGGTSIAAVSADCGLPASSIYWHFNDKDDLIAAVIDHSFEKWLSAWELPGAGSASVRAQVLARQIARALLDSPDFIRLGLMLTLEHRPDEPRARSRFLAVRAEAFCTLERGIREVIPELSPEEADRVTTYAMAGADGLFIAKEIGGDSVDLTLLFELHARSVYDAITRIIDADGEQGVA